MLKPISSITGEGLAELVSALFNTLPDKVSLAKLQESLNTERKLSRLAFVVTEASDLLAKIAFLDGEQTDEIEVCSIMLFAVICNHFAVGESKWMELNGDAMKIAEEVKRHGMQTVEEKRAPSGFWENLFSFFGAGYTHRVVRYHKLGFDGLQELVPRVYATIHQVADLRTRRLSDEEVRNRLENSRTKIKQAIDRNTPHELMSTLQDVLDAMLEVQR